MAVPYSRTIVGRLPWYSVLIVCGIALAIWLADREEKRLELPKDTAVDLALVVVPFGIIGARLYYVAMSWRQFAAQPWSVLYIWQGGIAIYGAVIGGALGAWLYARRKQLSFSAVADLIVPGLLLAQAIGRWGNYFNMEAYGPVVQHAQLQFFPMAVLIPSEGGYVWHAATFFYESLWNLCGFALLWRLRVRQKQPGNLTAWYFVVYGSGRFIIEQLRQDSLYLGPLRASQYLSLLLCTAAGFVLLRRHYRQNRSTFWLAAACLILWLLRWSSLRQPGMYAALLLIAGVAAVWLVRGRRRALALLALGIGLDGIGLLCALTRWPVSNGFAIQIHTVLCSLTLVIGLLALMQENE